MKILREANKSDFEIENNVLIEYSGTDSDVTIPNKVKSIGPYAFSGCTGLTSVTIPDCVTSIETNVFFNCTNLSSISVNANNVVYHSAGNCIIKTESKTLIAGCKNSIIPADGSVISIGSCTFCGCEGLTNVTIPDSVMSIGKGAFYGCSGLTNVTIGNSVMSIGDSAFWDCMGLMNVIIPDSVTSIGGGAFSWCTNLISINIPNSVTDFGPDVFKYCSSLKSIFTSNQIVIDQLLEDGISKDIIKTSVYDLYDTEED